jgi:peptide/nickel transport system permease protein
MLMSDLLLRVARRDGGRYRNPWLAPGTSIPLLLVLLLVVAVFFPSLFTPYTPDGFQRDFAAAGPQTLVRY